MKNILVLLLLCAQTFTTIAQTPDTKKRRIYICEGVGYGVGSVYGVFIPFHGDKPIVAKPSISISAGYIFSKKFSLGIAGGYYRIRSSNEHWERGYPNYNPTHIDYSIVHSSVHSSLEYYYLGLEAKFLYATIVKKRYDLYGAASLGFSKTYETYGGDYYEFFPNRNKVGHWGSIFSPTMSFGWRQDINITAIGIRSTQRLFWYGELGFGYKGIVNAGVGYKL